MSGENPNQFANVMAATHLSLRSGRAILGPAIDCVQICWSASSIVCMLDGRSISLNKDHIFIAPINAIFEIAGDGVRPLWACSLKVDCLEQPTINAVRDRHHVFQLQGNAGTYLSKLLSNCESFAAEVPPNEDAVNRLGRAIAPIIDEMVGEAAISERLNPYQHGLFRRAEKYIIENATDKNLSSQSVANAVGIHIRQLTFVFKLGTGGTVTRSICDRRLEAARVLLSKRNGISGHITAVARECGFDCSSYFTRSFTKRFGQTPTAYVRACKRSIAH